MDIKSAKRIGSKQTVYAVAFALLVAYSIMALLTQEVFWLFLDIVDAATLAVNTIAGAVFILLIGIFIGRYTGTSIIIKKKNCYWVSIRNNFFILFLGTLLASGIGFFEEGIHETGVGSSPVFDYIGKPLFLVSEFGFVPTIIIAAILGWSIKRKGADKKNK